MAVAFLYLCVFRLEINNFPGDDGEYAELKTTNINEVRK